MPRWFDTARTITNAEAGSLRLADRSVVDSVAVDEVNQEWETWQTVPSIGRTHDLLNWPDHLLGVNRRPQLLDFLSSQGEARTDTLDSTSGDLVQADRAAIIRATRRGLANFPRNSLAWLDMARHRVQLGGDANTAKAKKYVRAAVQLASGHRLVVRAAARFYVHINQPDVALDVVRKALRDSDDPWLLSAEIACADIVGRSPAQWKKVKQCIEAAAYRPEHLTELYTAAAGLELAAGERKLAKRLFERALKYPNENVLAQILVTSRVNHLSLPINETVDSLQASEPRLWHELLNRHDPAAALVACNQWRELEPFSGRPYVMGSYLAALLGDFALSAKIAADGMTPEPDDLTLAGNYYYARLSSEQLVEVDQDEAFFDGFARWLRVALDTSRSMSDRIQPVANFGLYLYRSGDANQGRLAYERAIKLAESCGNFALALGARAMQAREALRSNAPWADEVMREALRAKNYDIDVGASYTIDQLQGIPKAQSLTAKTPTRVDSRVKFTMDEHGATIWLPKKPKESPIWKP